MFNSTAEFLKQFQVYVGDVFCGQLSYQAGKSVYEIACDGFIGNYVRIVQENNILTLCEVEVYGRPSQGENQLSILPGIQLTYGSMS